MAYFWTSKLSASYVAVDGWAKVRGVFVSRVGVRGNRMTIPRGLDSGVLCRRLSDDHRDFADK